MKEEYDKNNEELLLELKNKKIMAAIWIIMLLSTTFYIGVLLLANYAFGEGFEFAIIASVSTVLFILTCCIALYFEVNTGYYICKKCNHKFVPKYFEALFAMHIGTTRYLKCPECNERSWSKKVMHK